MSLAHVLIIRLVILLSLLIFTQALPSLHDNEQSPPARAVLGKQMHTPIARQTPIKSRSQLANRPGLELERCHVLANNNWYLINAVPPHSSYPSSVNISANPLPHIESFHLGRREPDPPSICSQIAGFRFAISSSFASTQPLHLLPSRTYVFSISSSVPIRSIICWRRGTDIIARKGPMNSTRATLRFSLQESAEVHFSIIWNSNNGWINLGTGLFMPLAEPQPTGEVALFVVPGFAGL